MSTASEEARMQRRQSRARLRLRQRIERARWRCGRRDWIVSETELDVILAGAEPKQAKCLNADTPPALPALIVELPFVEQSTPTTTRATSADQVFKLIRSGVQTWDALLKQMRLDDESLGLALADLFNERRIRSYDVGEVRIYAIR